jgi:microcystin degradation protein MlrC
MDAELIWSGDGEVTGDGPMLKGLIRDFGPTVVLRVSGIDMVVVSNPHQMLDLQQFKTFGINPEDYNVVALKSEQHFRAAFGPISGEIIVCDGGGLSSPQYKRKHFPKVPTPTFPLEDMEVIDKNHDYSAEQY